MHVNAFIYFFRFSLYLYTDQHVTHIVDYVSQLICHLFNEPREYFLIYFSYFWSSRPVGGTFIGTYRICMWSIYKYTSLYIARIHGAVPGQLAVYLSRADSIHSFRSFILFMHFDFGAYFI